MTTVFLMVGHGDAMAAQCADVFGDDSGINENLASSRSTLDLAGVSWANNNWPASGTTLSGGDYFFRDATLGNNYRLNIADGAQVRIFVNGSLRSGNNIRLNDDGDAGRFLLVTRGNLAFGNNADVMGLVYAAGAISVGNNLEASGSFGAGGSIGPGNPNIDFDDSGVDNGLLVGLCDYGTGGQVVLSANGVADGPVNVGVGGDVALSAVASDCPVEPPGYILRGWRDTWLIDGAVVSQETYVGVSACDRSPIGRTEVFPNEGLHEVLFQTEYIDCFFGFFCGRWQPHGQDAIQINAQDANALTCFNDEFQGGTLAPDDWVTSVSSGNFQPGIASNGRLRMTESVSNQATAATLQREIPGAENLVVLEFDYYAYGGSGADGLAFVLSDANYTPQPGSYGGSLGYAQRGGGNTGFAGGWIGIGLDEYGNFSNPSEGRIGGPGFRRDAIAIRGAAPDYRYLEGTQTLNPGVDTPNSNNPSPQRYRITVDSRIPGQALVSVERDTTGTRSNYQELIAPFNALAEPGQPAVPENFLLSMTGSTGGSNNIHEFDNFQLCALKLNPVGEQVDHFEILHDGVALTCQPETITIRACANADCSQLFTDPVDATMAPSGWVGGDVVRVSGGETQAQLAIRSAQSPDPTLDVIGSNPSTRPQAETLCQIGGSGLSANNCDLPFLSSGLAFDMPDRVANTPATSVRISALEQSDTNPEACVPAFSNVTRGVSLWSTYVLPDDAGISSAASIAVDGSDIGKSSGTASKRSLAFDANGQATIDVAYPEAGRMQLNALYQGGDATNDAGLTMPGSDLFVSSPAGFCIEAVSPNAECTGDLATCSVLTAAGAGFTVRSRAVGWQTAGESGADFCVGNSTTRNFRFSDLALEHSLTAPAAGALGNLGTDEVDFGSADAGAISYEQTISEVGVFELTIPAAQIYLGGVALPGGRSQSIGRLTPADFLLSVDDVGQLGATCTGTSGFTYNGQPFGWSAGLEPVVRITARSASNPPTVTTNYTRGDFMKLTAADVTTGFPATDDNEMLSDDSALMPVSSTAGTGSLTTLSPGILNYTFSAADSLSYDKTKNARVAAFTPALTFSVDAVTDGDGVAASNVALSWQADSAFDIRYGRLTMDNVYGPETAGTTLTMPFRAEYWNGARFRLNEEDSCTVWTTANVANTGTVSTLSAANGQLGNGLGPGLTLSPTGRGTDTLTWNVDIWLEADWNGDGALQDPRGLATFGVYRGHDRIIYWREN